MRREQKDELHVYDLPLVVFCLNIFQTFLVRIFGNMIGFGIYF